MKYDLEGGPLSSGIDSRATETACFDGFLFGFLRKRLSIDCRDFSFSFWCPLVEKAQQIAVAQTPCLRFQIWQPQVEKSDANAICIMYSRFPNQACARIACLFLPTRDFHLDEMLRKNYTLSPQIVGFNETIRNWREEWCFTSSSRGIGIQFSTSNNTTSLDDHWLVYCHCAKLRHWDKVEKLHLPCK